MHRYAAFLKGEVYDRPPISITFWKEDASSKPSSLAYLTEKERWMDIEYRAKYANYVINSTEYYADAFPGCYPDLGPGVYSAAYGCEYQFGNDTAWTYPIILDWEKDIKIARIDCSSEYFVAVEMFTKELLKHAKDKFAVGFTDLHPGADHLAALRGSENLCYDLYENPEFVKAILNSSYEEYFDYYNHFYNMIREEGGPATSWIPLVTDGKFHVVGHDFTCMISTKMFEEFFLEGITQECEELDYSIYHLDGPDALKHLDVILNIKKLNAVQWICGAGKEGFLRWVDVYRKIQKAHKGIWLGVDVCELDDVFTSLKPDGIWFSYINGIISKEHADSVIKRITHWR